jgi:hypothetical protein
MSSVSALESILLARCNPMTALHFMFLP